MATDYLGWEKGAMRVDSTIRVLVVDDHLLVRQGIRNQLAHYPDIELVAEGTAGAKVLPLVAQHKPDVLLLDLRMPQFEEGRPERFQALPTVVLLLERFPETAVILLTQEYTPVIIEAAIERGVRGYILKSDALSQDIATAILTVNRGGVFFSETIGAELSKRNRRTSTKQELGLTGRQLEILIAIATSPNDSYTQQAQKLEITESTLKSHLTRAFKALDAKNATAAIIKCMQLGLIPPPETTE